MKNDIEQSLEYIEKAIKLLFHSDEYDNKDQELEGLIGIYNRLIDLRGALCRD